MSVQIQYNDQIENFAVNPDEVFSPQTLKNRFCIATSNSLVLTDTDGFDVIIDATLPAGNYVLYSRSPSTLPSKPSYTSFASTSHTDYKASSSTYTPPTTHKSSAAGPAARRSSSHSVQDSKGLIELKDKLAITEAIDTLSHSIDNGDWKQWSNIFADNVTNDFQSLNSQPPVTLSRDELITRWRGTLGLFDATQHMITNHLITLRGDTAEVISHAQTTQFLSVGSDKDDWINRGLHGQEYQTVSGKFHFGLTRSKLNGNWQFHSVKLTVVARHGNKDLLQVALRRNGKKSLELGSTQISH